MMEAFNQNEPTEAARIPNERVVALRAVADASERVAAENMVNLCRWTDDSSTYDRNSWTLVDFCRRVDLQEVPYNARHAMFTQCLRWVVDGWGKQSSR